MARIKSRTGMNAFTRFSRLHAGTTLYNKKKKMYFKSITRYSSAVIATFFFLSCSYYIEDLKMLLFIGVDTRHCGGLPGRLRKHFKERPIIKLYCLPTENNSQHHRDTLMNAFFKSRNSMSSS